MAELSAAESARVVAQQIDRLPDVVVASFALGDRHQRIARLKAVTTEIICNAFSIVAWLERQRPAQTAEMEKRRLFGITDEAVACAGMDIPEYAGGVIGPSEPFHKPSDGARRTAKMAVGARVIAASLNHWGAEIERESTLSQSINTAVGELQKALAARKEDDGLLTVEQLCERLPALKSKTDGARREWLRRFRKDHPHDFEEIADAAGRKPPFLYRIGAIKRALSA